tara:strand:+ start:1332 stop:1586 length:255 start_codon:yes stop_codon:yes gene_type:complete
MLTLKSATNPIYGNEEQTVINLEVIFEEIQEVLPFTASPNCDTDYGRDIYNRARTGEFGEIASFVPRPTFETVNQPSTTGTQNA